MTHHHNTVTAAVPTRPRVPHPLPAPSPRPRGTALTPSTWHRAHPVHVAQTDFYHGFCRGYLRPLFHNVLRLPEAADPFSEAEWRAYCTANKKFAEKVRLGSDRT